MNDVVSQTNDGRTTWIFKEMKKTIVLKANEKNKKNYDVKNDVDCS